MSEVENQNIKVDAEKLNRAESDLEYFWHQEGVLDPNRIPPNDKRIIFDLPLALYAEHVAPSPHFPEERNRRVEVFAEQGWLPKSSAEIRMVAAADEEEIFETEGPEERFRRAKHTELGEGSRAQKATFETLDRYLLDAKADRSILTRARIISSESNIGDIRTIRSDAEILNVIGDYLCGREILDRGWDHNRNTVAFKERQRYWRGFMQAAVQPGFASDAALLAIFEKTWETARARTEYWREQSESAYKKVGHLLVSDVQETESAMLEPLEQPTPEAENSESPEQSDARAPWERERPVRPGENYMLDGMDQIPVIEKTEDERHPQVVETPTVLPKQLFSTKEMESKPKRKRSRRSGRPPVTRNNLGSTGKMIADDDKEVEYDRLAAEGRL